MLVTEEQNQTSASLECPICCELFDNAFETMCGHAFCEYCILKALESSNGRCPICRKDPSPVHPSFTLRALVQEERSKRLPNKEHQPESDESDSTEPHEEDELKNGKGVREQYLGNICYRRGTYADAIKHYNKALSSGNANAVLYGNRAASFFKLRQFRAALDDYQRAEVFDSNNVKLLLGKALTLERLRHYRASYSCYQQALKLLSTTSTSSSTKDDNPCYDPLRMDIIAGLQRISSLARYISPSTAVTTMTPINIDSSSANRPTISNYYPITSHSTAVSPFISFQTIPTFQWQIHQELTFKEFLGSSV